MFKRIWADGDEKVCDEGLVKDADATSEVAQDAGAKQPSEEGLVNDSAELREVAQDVGPRERWL